MSSTSQQMICKWVRFRLNHETAPNLLYLTMNYLFSFCILSVTHNIEKQTGCALFAAQFKAMFYKRVIYTLRNKLLTVSQIILPLFFTALTVLIMKTSPSDVGIATAAPLNLNMFGKTDVSIDYR